MQTGDKVAFRDINLWLDRGQRGIITEILSEKLVSVRWQRNNFDSTEYLPNLQPA